MDHKTFRQRVGWATRTLRKLGYLDVQPPTRISRNPWSLIARITSANGVFFLKYVRGAFRQEPGLTDALHGLAPAHVPELIAADDTLACWIVRDAGDGFAPSMEPDFGLPVLGALLADHAALQRKTLADARRWLGLGAKDVRPDRYSQYLDEILRADSDLTQDRVPQATMNALRTAGPGLSDVAQRLIALSPPQTVTHMDLRLTNIRRAKGAARLIDWGDAGFGPAFLDHVPLFSELSAGPVPTDRINALLQSTLSHWTDHAPLKDLQAAHRLCRIVYPMLYAHGLIHARPSWDPTLTPGHHGLLRFYLTTFLQRLNA